jgi:hypothetical protein
MQEDNKMLVDIKTILVPAKENGFAVPAFNVSSSMLLRGVIEGCEEKGSPVIVAIHPDELSFVMNSFAASVLERPPRETSGLPAPGSRRHLQSGGERNTLWVHVGHDRLVHRVV